ncbi:hypothetical protein SteCoe_17101 [Stentor coeruleus]|uniref:Uncharacterized protein n=1 Tax=Stentor coeruleus TaxID=5963 RepID=A0A1R2BZZ4_9CILI|nr:hypothetical protein SteCoe_17101 [Stentor coeruleus]
MAINAANSNTYRHKVTKNLTDLLYMERISDLRKIKHNLRSHIVQEIANYFFIENGRSFKNTIDLCLNKNSFQVSVILIREKNTNKLIGASIMNMFLIINLPNDSTSENTFIVIVAAGAVNENYRNSKISRYAFGTFEKYLLLDYPNHNSIYFNVFSNPFSFSLLSNSARFSFPGTLGTQNSILEAFMTKALIYYSNTLTKVSNDNPFLYKGHRILPFDKQYLIENYIFLPKSIQYYIDVTGLKHGYGLIGLHPILMHEKNTLRIDPGDNFPNRLVFEGEIRNIESNSYSL